MQTTLNHLVLVPRTWGKKRAGASSSEDALRVGGASPRLEAYEATWAKALHPQDKKGRRKGGSDENRSPATGETRKDGDRRRFRRIVKGKRGGCGSAQRGRSGMSVGRADTRWVLREETGPAALHVDQKCPKHERGATETSQGHASCVSYLKG